MADVRCADGSLLGVHPEPVLDRDGVPYEVTLRLTLDGAPFGAVGERCGYFLAASAARLRRALGSDEQLPESSTEAGVRAWARDAAMDADATWSSLERYLPRDRELFAFRSRDPDDLSTVGELRVRLEVVRRWSATSVDALGAWQREPCAVLEAWGSGGRGVRAVLPPASLLALLERLVEEFGDVGAPYDRTDDASVLRRPVG